MASSVITTGDARTLEHVLVGGAPATLVVGAASQRRRRIIIQNTTDKVVYVGFNSLLTAANGYPLKPMSGAATFDGGVVELEDYHGLVYAFSADAATLRIIEVGVN